jgi:UDP-glucose 4-epimerase
MVHSFITGGAGFIGSSLADRLLAEGRRVTVYDNFSTGQERFLENAIGHPHFHLVHGDTLESDLLTRSMADCQEVFHLAANADVRFGLDHPRKDLEQNTLATFNVLEAMRKNGIKSVAFASTGSVYGEPEVFPTPEDAPFPIQTSMYAASKLAGEALIQAYCEGYGFAGYIFRFVSILGERYSHGHVFDFSKQLGQDPSRLQILGDGAQRKSYLYIQDCLDAVLLAMEARPQGVNIFNLGTAEYCQVTQSVEWICQTLRVSPKLSFTGGQRGWVGDSPFIFLDCSRIRALGWKPKLNIEEAVKRTARYIKENSWLLEAR